MIPFRNLYYRTFGCIGFPVLNPGFCIACSALWTVNQRSYFVNSHTISGLNCFFDLYFIGFWIYQKRVAISQLAFAGCFSVTTGFINTLMSSLFCIQIRIDRIHSAFCQNQMLRIDNFIGIQLCVSNNLSTL